MISRLWALIKLFVIFVKEVLISSLKVLSWIYTQSHKLESEFFELHLEVKEKSQQILIAHFITLTPGTLAIEITKHRSIIVHILKKEEREATMRLIKQSVEPLVKKLWGQQ